MALVTTALLEIAEFYSQELYRRGVQKHNRARYHYPLILASLIE